MNEGILSLKHGSSTFTCRYFEDNPCADIKKYAIQCCIVSFSVLLIIMTQSNLRYRAHDKLDSQGDFLVHFMDISRDELAKKPEEISVEKLQVR